MTTGGSSSACTQENEAGAHLGPVLGLPASLHLYAECRALREQHIAVQAAAEICRSGAAVGRLELCLHLEDRGLVPGAGVQARLHASRVEAFQALWYWLCHESKQVTDRGGGADS